MFHVLLRRTRLCGSSAACKLSSTSVAKKAPTSVTARSLILNMEEIVQRDEGKRGIKEIFLPPGELVKSAEEMVTAKNVVIVTGFPCLLEYTPPTETDGPLGAAAIAKTLLYLGKKVTILTDTCNEDVLLSCCAASGISQYGERFSLESFPPLGDFDERDYRRLARYSDSDAGGSTTSGVTEEEDQEEPFDLFIAIERAGPNYEGSYRTMRNRDMSHLIAPLENILPYNDDLESSPAKRHLKPMRSIGIGDGGNEVGMGRVYDKVLSSKIINAKEIACVVPTDHLIIASVSNWGGYALGAAAAVVHATRLLNVSLDTNVAAHLDIITKTISEAIPTNEEEVQKCQRSVEAGARDGMTAKQELIVDGMPLSESLRVLDELRNVSA